MPVVCHTIAAHLEDQYRFSNTLKIVRKLIAAFWCKKTNHYNEKNYFS